MAFFIMIYPLLFHPSMWVLLLLTSNPLFRLWVTQPLWNFIDSEYRVPGMVNSICVSFCLFTYFHKGKDVTKLGQFISGLNKTPNKPQSLKISTWRSNIHWKLVYLLWKQCLSKAGKTAWGRSWGQAPTSTGWEGWQKSSPRGAWMCSIIKEKPNLCGCWKY